MHIEHHHWFSERLGKEMGLNVYGYYGLPIIVFPCSKGRYFDYENFGMIEAISWYIESGKIKLFTVDSIDEESWYDMSVLPGDRSARHEQYDAYICQEVIPFIRNHCQDQQVRVLANGASMGAYHALNFFLKHPDLFSGCIALSGLYNLNRAEFGIEHFDIPFVYFNSPVHYLPDLNDQWYLDWYRKSDIIVCVGQGAWEHEAIEDTMAIQQILQAKNVDAWIDYWGFDVNHDWPWWYKQMNFFLSKLV